MFKFITREEGNNNNKFVAGIKKRKYKLTKSGPRGWWMVPSKSYFVVGPVGGVTKSILGGSGDPSTKPNSAYIVLGPFRGRKVCNYS